MARQWLWWYTRVALIGIGISLLAFPAMAQESGDTAGAVTAQASTLGGQPGSELSGEHPAEVSLAGVVAFRFVATVHGHTPMERADIVYQRLWDALEKHWGTPANIPALVNVVKMRGDYTIVLGDTLILTIDEAHAKRLKTSPASLAAVWAENLRGALSAYVALNAPLP